jgi:hypothetical protein
VDGTELVVGDAAATRRTALTTLRAAAVFAGVTPGAPAQVYQPATPLDPDEPLMIDPQAARLLAEWYQLGAQALSQLAAEMPGDRRVEGGGDAAGWRPARSRSAQSALPGRPIRPPRCTTPTPPP